MSPSRRRPASTSKPARRPRGSPGRATASRAKVDPRTEPVFRADFVVETAHGHEQHSVRIFEPQRTGALWGAWLTVPLVRSGVLPIWGATPEQAMAHALDVARALYTGAKLTTPDGKRFRWPTNGRGTEAGGRLTW